MPILGVREEYNDLKSTFLARQIVTALTELHDLSDHNYMTHNLSRNLDFNPKRSNKPSSQAFFASRSQNSWGRGSNICRGRGSLNNHQSGNNRNQFSWASNQNTVYDTCNKCGIGHIPSQFPNREPTTIRLRQQQP
ncbi:hypothetical protein LXL04_020597 [Taraxacum kok-saghyz]